VLPEGCEPRVLRAAAEVTRRGLADLILLGNAHAIQARTILPALARAA
jgi:phosphotransacetylase